MTHPVQWDDDLIWCPSQCYADVAYPDGTPAVLYLRWRWSDPWQASIIKGVTSATFSGGEWLAVDIGDFRDDQLIEAKAALIAAWNSSRS